MCVVSRSPRQGSVLLLTNKTIAIRVTPESGLVPEGILMIPIRVETLLKSALTMEIKTSQPWATFLSIKLTSTTKSSFFVKTCQLCPTNSDVEVWQFLFHCSAPVYYERRRGLTSVSMSKDDEPEENVEQNGMNSARGNLT